MSRLGLVPPNRVAAGALAALLLPSCSRPVGEGAQEIAAAADAYLSTATSLGRFSGAVLIARGDTLLFRRGYGFRDVERGRELSSDTQFPIASISKMFTAMAAATLRDAGRLAWDESISTLLPDCPAAWRSITVRHLVHHTSGLPDYEAPLELGSPAYLDFMARPEAWSHILQAARAQPLDFAPGEGHRYSNTGYVLLGLLVERAAGEPFGEYLRRTLLLPAGMNASGVFGTSPAPERLAIGYTHGSLGWGVQLAGFALDAGHLTAVPALPLDPPSGDAGMYSTVEDLWRWSSEMDGGDLVPRARVEEALRPDDSGYGFGWQIDEAFGRVRQHHNGFLPGFASELVRFPEERLTIVVLSNLDRIRLSALVRDLSAIALGEPHDLPVSGQVVEVGSAELAALVGNYRGMDSTLYSVRQDPEMLVVEKPGFFTAGLIPLSPTEFFVPLTTGRAVFSLGADGRAVELNLRYHGRDHRGVRE